MLSKVGNPALSSLNAVLAATGLRLSVKPVEKRQQKATVAKLAGIKMIKAEMPARVFASDTVRRVLFGVSAET